jgi:hypothetical protein
LDQVGADRLNGRKRPREISIFLKGFRAIEIPACEVSDVHWRKTNQPFSKLGGVI